MPQVHAYRISSCSGHVRRVRGNYRNRHVGETMFGPTGSTRTVRFTMFSSRCINLVLHNTRCRGSAQIGHGLSSTTCATFSMSAIRSKVAGPAYLQKPDKTHPIPTSSVAPDVVPNRASITKPKSKPIKLKAHVPDTQQEPEAQTMEEQLKMMDRLVATQDLVKIDYWSQPVGLFGQWSIRVHGSSGRC